MTAPTCACGYTRENIDGIWVCEDHCDIGCDNPDTCARCRTYTVTAGKRASA